MKKRLLFIVCAVMLFGISTLNDLSAKNKSTVAYIGEEIEYDVSFLGITLGHIKVITDSSYQENGRTIFVSRAFMKSADGIPYASLNSIFKSFMDQSLSYSHKFQGSIKFMTDHWGYQEIDFKYDENKIDNKAWYNKKPKYSVGYDISSKWNDGLSLFFLARQYCNLKREIRVPTIIDKDTASTYIRFSGRKEAVEIDEIDYPVRTVYLDGTADWEGIYGLQGEFEGWFSDDEARIPIMAKMNVLVGSVTIELKKWKRGNWQPPRAKES